MGMMKLGMVLGLAVGLAAVPIHIEPHGLKLDYAAAQGRSGDAGGGRSGGGAGAERSGGSGGESAGRASGSGGGRPSDPGRAFGLATASDRSQMGLDRAASQAAQESAVPRIIEALQSGDFPIVSQREEAEALEAGFE